MKILAGVTSHKLGEEIAKKLSLPLINLIHKQFTDGETYLQIEGKVEDEDVIIIQNTFPNQEKHLIEIMLIASTLKEYNASKVILLSPYLAYSRADRRRKEKEVISHKVILELLYKSGVDSVITFDVHNRESFTSFVPELEKFSITTIPLISDYLRSKIKDNSILVGPDKGISEELEYLSLSLKVPFGCLEKFRDPDDHKIIMKDPGLELKGKNVVLLDDVITSGGTAIDACKLILKKKPQSLIFIVIHPIAKSEVFERMMDLGVSQIISTNTISRDDIEQIDVSSFASNFIEEKFL